MAHDVPARLTAAQGRRFGVTVGIAFLVLAGLLWWRAHPVMSTVAASLGGALVLAGAVIPDRLGPVQRGWMRFAFAISKVTTPVHMAIVYVLVLTPIGLIRRTAGKNPLVGRSSHTRWEERGAQSRSDLHRQF